MSVKSMEYSYRVELFKTAKKPSYLMHFHEWLFYFYILYYVQIILIFAILYGLKNQRISANRSQFKFKLLNYCFILFKRFSNFLASKDSINSIVGGKKTLQISMHKQCTSMAFFHSMKTNSWQLKVPFTFL